MSILLNDKFIYSFIKKKEILNMQQKVDMFDEMIKMEKGVGENNLGWYTLPDTYDKKEVAEIKKCATEISGKYDTLVVIGVGGSYLGAKAVIEFIKSTNYNLLKKETPEIYFVGNNVSAKYMSEFMSILEGKNYCVNVISKSGTTTEPAIAFRFIRNHLEKKYGNEGARERIIATTDNEKGALHILAKKKGYKTFNVPKNIGGRYSVLTAVGLLPVAVCGIDIEKLLEGAKIAKQKFTNSNLLENDAYRYAVIRNLLYQKGKKVEILASFEPDVLMLHEWYKQLFGESEGKDGKGIFPVSVMYSTDLHSFGQFIQDGDRMLFETIINIENNDEKILIPSEIEDIDQLNYLSNRKLNEVNKIAKEATVLAHVDGGVPCLLIEVEKKDEINLGYLLFFFELAVAMSGYILGVNPFNQPGVEEYKKNMFALLGKPGYDEKRQELLKRLK